MKDKKIRKTCLAVTVPIQSNPGYDEKIDDTYLYFIPCTASLPSGAKMINEIIFL